MLPAKNTAKAGQHRPAPAVAVRDRPDHELADREYREEDRDRRRSPPRVDTFSDAAICGSDGSRILVASVPVAASTASTAICRTVEETSGRGLCIDRDGLVGHGGSLVEYDMMCII